MAPDWSRVSGSSTRARVASLQGLSAAAAVSMLLVFCRTQSIPPALAAALIRPSMVDIIEHAAGAEEQTLTGVINYCLTSRFNENL